MSSILSMQGITKQFPGVVANDNINLTLYPGEIHALLGENGAGKTTLMNILMGIYQPDSGRIFFDQKEIRLGNPRSAIDLGIGMVHQHFKLIDTLTVAENIYLSSRKSCRFILDQKMMEAKILEFSKECNMPIDPAAKIYQLSVGEQQRVEIIKLLFCGNNILILDEPTSILTPQETKILFGTLRHLAKNGKTILFITHKLFEVMEYSDRITVLRKGRTVSMMKTKEATEDELIALMVGGKLGKVVAGHIDAMKRMPILSLQNVKVMDDRNRFALNKLNLTLNSFEIVGLAGIAGNGQMELAEVISGMKTLSSGEITFDGQSISNNSVRKIRKAGIAYVPEDRMGVGLVGGMNILENAILRQYDSERFNSRGVLKKGKIREFAELIVERFDIQSAGHHFPVSVMSGGNLQKLLFAREISGNPRVIVVAYPTHGVDVGATIFIHNILFKERAKGTAVLVISENLEELYKLSDRIAVIYEGKIVGEVSKDEFTFDRVGRMMTGGNSLNFG